MKIKSLPKVDLPREKLEKYGVVKLSNHELLAILLGSGIEGLNVLELSKKILKIISKDGVDKTTFEQLLKIKGLGKAKASQIIAVIELGKRLQTTRNPEIISPEIVWSMSADFRDSKKEHLAVFYIDTQNHLIERQIISIGTLNTNLIHPREVFEPAVALHAANVIIAHNHPAGDVKPSTEDKDVTRQLIEAGKIIGIEVIDHIIVSKSDYLSFQEKNLI